MNVETFFGSFELLVDSINGVQKLRELILQLAIQGKLVQQEPDDEPASVLLEKLKKEKEKLIKEKKIKQFRSFPPILISDVKYIIPKYWGVERLGFIAHLITKGSTPTTYGFEFQSEGIRFVKIENVKGGRIVRERIKEFISEEAHQAQNRSQLNSNDILFSIAGTIGETCVVQNEDLPANTNQALAIIRGTKTVFQPEFLKIQLDSFVANAIKAKARGGAMNNVSLGDLKELIVLIPPLNEQKRIVAKVDQLMALCDQLEAHQQKKHEQRIRLNNAALDKLLTAPTSEEFAQYWQRICDNFDLLYDVPETVGQLRQAILQLAVQGKLVPQNLEDEPAAVLVEKIKAKKELRIEEGNFKKSKQLPLIKNTEIPCEVPKGWIWVRLNDITDIGTGSTPLKSNQKYYEDGSIPWITSSLTSQRYINEPDIFITQSAVNEYRLRKYPPNTLIIALYGQGKTRGQVSELKIEATINQACAAIVLIEPFEDIKNYIRLVLEKKYDELRSLAEGGAQPNLNVGKIKKIIIPFPPLEEQKRIVAKVDQLMALCDELEAGLVQAQTEGGKLMEAVVHHVLAA